MSVGRAFIGKGGAEQKALSPTQDKYVVKTVEYLSQSVDQCWYRTK